MTELIAGYLDTELGLPCRTAGSAEQAKRLLERDPFRLGIFDLMMPGTGGIELLDWTRVDNPDLAILIVTAVEDTQTAIECMRRGADDFLTKPFHLEELQLAVERAMERRELLQVKRRSELDEALHRFRNLLDRSTDGIYVIEPGTGRVLDVNRPGCQALGYDRLELLEMRVQDVAEDVPDPATWSARLAEIRARGSMRIADRHVRKDGSSFPVRGQRQRRGGGRCTRVPRRRVSRRHRAQGDRGRAPGGAREAPPSPRGHPRSHLVDGRSPGPQLDPVRRAGRLRGAGTRCGGPVRGPARRGVPRASPVGDRRTGRPSTASPTWERPPGASVVSSTPWPRCTTPRER